MIEIDPERLELVAEMHLRPIPRLEGNSRMVQVLSLVAPGDGEAVAEFLNSAYDCDPVSLGRRDGRMSRRGCEFLWERHAEALTLTAILPPQSSAEHEQDALALLENVPGRILRAIKIRIVEDNTTVPAILEEDGLHLEDTVAGESGPFRFWSDFRLREEDGYGRLVVASTDGLQHELGRFVRDIQEMGNYRNLALLGLPLVRQRAADLAALEQGAAELTSLIAVEGDDRAALDDLLQISADLSRLRSETAYRLGATAAYGRIVTERIATLDARPLDHFQSLAEFTNRRFLPALRTCENFSERVDSLALRLEQSSGLLRARIETQVQEQNRELLGSLERTARRQLQLQHLVERLSVFAVAYYAIGLLGYLLGVLPETVVPDHKLAIGLAVVPVTVFLAVMLRRHKQG